MFKTRNPSCCPVEGKARKASLRLHLAICVDVCDIRTERGVLYDFLGKHTCLLRRQHCFPFSMSHLCTPQFARVIFSNEPSLALGVEALILFWLRIYIQLLWWINFQRRLSSYAKKTRMLLFSFRLAMSCGRILMITFSDELIQHSNVIVRLVVMLEEPYVLVR